jgi:hypothetical protein
MAQVTVSDDLLLTVDDDVRRWLDASGFGEVPDGATIGVRGAIAYIAPEPQPTCLGPEYPGRPVKPLPEDLAARADWWIVADINLPDLRSGNCKRVPREAYRDSGRIAQLRIMVEQRARHAANTHLGRPSAPWMPAVEEVGAAENDGI